MQSGCPRVVPRGERAGRRCPVVSRDVLPRRVTGARSRVTAPSPCWAPAASAGHNRDRDDQHAVLLVRGAERAADREIVRRLCQEILHVHIKRLLRLTARSGRIGGYQYQCWRRHWPSHVCRLPAPPPAATVKEAAAPSRTVRTCPVRASVLSAPPSTYWSRTRSLRMVEARRSPGCVGALGRWQDRDCVDGD